jgi:hypothetical protein
MNTTIQLSINQETNRQVKGWTIYNDGLVEKLDNRTYLVKGKYTVEDLTMDGEDIDPFFRCSCPDHNYRGVRCGHIIAVEFYIIENGA